jgi:hypothetical protein
MSTGFTHLSKADLPQKLNQRLDSRGAGKQVSTAGCRQTTTAQVFQYHVRRARLSFLVPSRETE